MSFLVCLNKEFSIDSVTRFQMQCYELLKEFAHIINGRKADALKARWLKYV